ncbi:MAG: hypothetical protein IPL39_11510 [Opitutaceae bacterium]|nr:hypothetical protein [Opitutaceae bacterium]
MIRRTLALTALLAYAASFSTAAPEAETTAPSAAATRTEGDSAPDAPPVQPKLFGRISDGLYHAPSGAFSVPVPKLNGDSAVIMDTDTVAVFKDKTSVLVTIAAFPMPAFARWEYQTKGARDYLIAFFRDNILRDYTAEFPESRVENVKFLPEYHGGTLLAYTVMPGGSAFSLDPVAAALPGHAPGIAKRGHLVFVKNDLAFVLAVELAERVTQKSTYQVPAAEEDRVLLDRLVTIVTAMQIPAATTPLP